MEDSPAFLWCKSWILNCLPASMSSSPLQRVGSEITSGLPEVHPSLSTANQKDTAPCGPSVLQQQEQSHPQQLSPSVDSKLPLYPLEPTTTSENRVKGCVFSDVSTERGFNIVHEEKDYVVFKDRSPGSQVHLLAIPKAHIDNVKTLQRSHLPILHDLERIGRKVLKGVGVEVNHQRLGFHIPPFFSVNHLHLHLLSTPIPFPGNIKYRPSIPRKKTNTSSPSLFSASRSLSSSSSASASASTPTSRNGVINTNDTIPASAPASASALTSASTLASTLASTPESVSASASASTSRPNLIQAASTHTKVKSEKLKGFSWFVDIDQIVQILQAGQTVKVGVVKAPPPTPCSSSSSRRE